MQEKKPSICCDSREVCRRTQIVKQFATRAFREFIIPLKKANLLPLSLSLSSSSSSCSCTILLLFHQKKKGILPGLIAACYELKSNARSSLQFLTPSPINTFRLLTIPLRVTLIWRESLAGIFDNERTSSVPCKCRHKRNEASHLTPCDYMSCRYNINIQYNIAEKVSK